MKPAGLTDREFRIVEAIVSRHLGAPYSQVEFCPLAIKQKRPRRYGRHRLQADTGASECWVFTKFGHRIIRYPRLEAFLSRMSSDLFRVPKFMGERMSSGFELAVWEDLPGEWKDFSKLEDYELDAVVDAVGAIHDLTESAMDCGVPNGTPWLKPFMVEVQAFARELDEQRLIQAAKVLAEKEHEILGALGSLGPLLFTHNDIAPTNLHWRPDGLVILDWEGATYALPGCGLRLTARLSDPKFDRAVKRYHQVLGSRARRLSENDLRYSIAAHEGIRSLVLAHRTRNSDLFLWGLVCLHRHILKSDMVSMS